MPVGDMLMQRPAAVRLKYRNQALRLTQVYWQQNSESLILEARHRVQELIANLEEETLPSSSLSSLERVSAHLGSVPELPKRQTPLPVVAFDYLEAVEDHLFTHAARLAHEAQTSRRLLNTELLPYLCEPETSWLGALEISQDLADDLYLAHREAAMLSRAVTAVRRASSNFCGADLRSADLNSAQLQGIEWDAATAWPTEWEERIRRASQATREDQTVLVVGIEPQGINVSADT